MIILKLLIVKIAAVHYLLSFFPPKVQSWSIRTGPYNISGPEGPQFAKSDNTLGH